MILNNYWVNISDYSCWNTITTSVMRKPSQIIVVKIYKITIKQRFVNTLNTFRVIKVVIYVFDSPKVAALREDFIRLFDIINFLFSEVSNPIPKL